MNHHPARNGPNAASIASLLLTTDAIVSEIKEDKPEPAGAPGGGMGGMY